MLILTEKDNPDWNSFNVWEMQVKLGGLDHFRSLEGLNNEFGAGTRLPKDIWSRDPEEIEALLERHSAFADDFTSDIKSIGSILSKLVTGAVVEGTN